MKRIYLSIFICCLTITIVSCEEGSIADGLFLYNNSKDTISVFASNLYPDTALFKDKPTSLLVSIYPKSFNYVPLVASPMGGLNSWDINKAYPRDTITVFILDDKLVSSSSWDFIRSNYLIIKRLYFSINDLIEKQWKVNYP